MLSEDKIKLMNSIASFEKREGRQMDPARRFFQGDYISDCMLRSFFAYTVSWLLCALLWGIYRFDSLLDTIDLERIGAMAKTALLIYVAGLAVYFVITWYIARRRYEYAQRRMRVYVAKLRRLEKRYDFQNRTRELSKEGGRHDDAAGT
ncbi:MAG: hypothetical protein LUE65_02425 [Clostridiales bacterium]|nr:hypothetical protein [Clostridiales bacterium]MCD8371411.1 hypothetical protein [Clostridiales bacterium]